MHQEVFKAELQHLVDEKVLQRISRSEWAFPTFLIPKKDGRGRWISDFCRLNKLLHWPRYFLPSIHAIMQKRAGFSYITKLDISMGFYTFELDSHAQQYCVTSTSFGLYKYLRLHMGLTNNPDIFQSAMHPLFQDISEVKCFIDDIAIFSNTTFDHHLGIVHQVLLRLEESGVTINLLKCVWAVQSTNYLGFLLSTDGIKPLPKKTEAISRILCPMSRTTVHSFVGLINYYKDSMWPRRAHIMASLTKLFGAKTRYNWTDTHENAFNLT